MKKTRLLHISGNRYMPLPAQHHTRRIWEELAKGFDEYHVVARGTNNKFSHSVSGNIHLHLMPSLGRSMWSFLFLSWVLPIYCLRYRATHLLVQCPVVGGMAGAFCSLVFRVPLFVEFHGAHYFYPVAGGRRAWLENRFYRYMSIPAVAIATSIRSLSVEMSNNIGRVYGVRALRKVVVVPNRVDLNVFSLTKKTYNVENPMRVVSVGSFVPGKNHRALISVLAQASFPSRLTLIGSGPLRDQYLDIARTLNYESQLTILESVSHASMATLLPEHDVYVHYSLSEAVSRAVLEAMAVGLPVVVTPVGFMEGILDDGRNAIILGRPFDENLIESLQVLQKSESYCRQLGSAARQDVEGRFEWNVVFELYRTAILDMR